MCNDSEWSVSTHTHSCVRFTTQVISIQKNIVPKLLGLESDVIVYDNFRKAEKTCIASKLKIDEYPIIEIFQTDDLIKK